ncbi:MAG TPA: hypothetical protein VJN48_16325 [Terriglobales bacterium]|nr:hypothetical protein [Terriglobales bacterium]
MLRLATFLGLCGFAATLLAPAKRPQSTPPTFYRDVLPILQQHCQSCHRPGEIAPMPLVTYQQTRSLAEAIRQAVTTRKMPPWFADSCCGHFANDSSLSARQIATISAWAEGGAAAGNPHDAPPPPHWVEGWNIARPDLVLRMPKPVPIPAHGAVEYTYEIVPTGFTQDRWVQMAEVRPSARDHVHHAVVYIRPPHSQWLQGAPVGVPFTASTLTNPEDRRGAHFTTADLLLVYAPGSSPDRWPEGLAKFIPAGSDLVFQMHYTTNGHAASDGTSIGLVFAKKTPQQRVLTLQLNRHGLMIPPHADHFEVEVQGTLPNDCTLLSFFPHMHLRGKRFEYNLVHSDGQVETLLNVNWDFYWQLSYRLAEPRLLKAGSKLQAIAWYDNSANNPHNPDPNATVVWGEQTWNEMMVGFFDVAVPASMSKEQFFRRRALVSSTP